MHGGGATDAEQMESRTQYPIGSMYGIYANIWGILMVNVTIYSIHGSYGIYSMTNAHLKYLHISPHICFLISIEKQYPNSPMFDPLVKPPSMEI